MNKQELLKTLLTKSISKHYAIKYINFIFSVKNKKENTYIENHHILPKAKTQFPEFENIQKHKWNNIKLSGREHFIAHWMLWKSQGNFMAYAFKSMNRKNKHQTERYFKMSSRIYENLKIESAKAQSKRIITDETRTKMSESQKKRKKYICPHCGAVATKLNLTKWHLDNCKVNTKKSKHDMSKMNSTKNKVQKSGLTIHQEIGQKQKGANNTSFRGYYILKDTKFETKGKLALYCNSTKKIVGDWCKNPYRKISKKSYNNSEYLQKHYNFKYIQNKTYYELGFSFLPKSDNL